MIPTYEDYKKSNARWNFTHNDTNFLVGFHGVDKYCPDGIWTYYVFFDEIMFQNKDDWKLFDLQPEITKPYNSYRECFPYYNIPELPWHGGPTFGEKIKKIYSKTGEYRTILKIGCDYSHIWDEEYDYPYNLDIVKLDAKNLINEFHRRFPQNRRCSYSGVVDKPDEFYVAKNGKHIHNSSLKLILKNNWPSWEPAESNII